MIQRENDKSQCLNNIKKQTLICIYDVYIIDKKEKKLFKTH